MQLRRIGAFALSTTTVVDRAYRLFGGVRSSLVATLATDGLLEAFNERAYRGGDAYDPHSSAFRSRLFNWEEDVFARHLPRPPARVLIGGAGGGREALTLVARGYETCAFDPSAALVRAMESSAPEGARLGSFVGRYEQLPHVTALAHPGSTDLSADRPFDAALFGWASYSHLRGSDRRVDALRRMAALTRGPVIFSFFPAPPAHAPNRLQRWAARVHLWSPHDRFTPVVGYYHLSTRAELLDEVARAGLTVVELSEDGSDGRWPYCVTLAR